MAAASKEANSSSLYLYSGTLEAAQINLSVDSFPRPTAGQKYTVIFNISFHIDGVATLCYLQVEVDNITFADQGELSVS